LLNCAGRCSFWRGGIEKVTGSSMREEGFIREEGGRLICGTGERAHRRSKADNGNTVTRKEKKDCVGKRMPFPRDNQKKD